MLSISLASSLNLCAEAEHTGVARLGKIFNTKRFPSKSFKVIFTKSLLANKKSGALEFIVGSEPERSTT